MIKEKLEASLAFAKEHGLSRIEVDGIVIHLDKPFVQPEEQALPDVAQFMNDISQEYTEEELLYWSTPFYDELQEKKKQHQESLKIHEDLKNG
jgi:hypothetical protein